jgi:glycosyltransferase involved in cell wall biosynthesis
MKKLTIIVDNMRIGGFQRLTLDQAYGLSKLGMEVNVLVLCDRKSLLGGSFFELENSLIEIHNISFFWLGDRHWYQLKFIRRHLQFLPEGSKVISHSLRGTALVWFAKKLTLSDLKLSTTIHQLPSLSRKLQRFKRFVYSQLSDTLFAYSESVKNDWNSRVNRNYLSRILIGRVPIRVLRNGIYLDRLPNYGGKSSSSGRPRLIFLGRNASWKGMSKFLEIASQETLTRFDILIMVPTDDSFNLSEIPEIIKSRVTVVTGRSIASLVPIQGDVHLYPSNYGHGVKYIESISLNCLEFACIGVPSLVTKGGLSTWMDLADTQIFNETAWLNLDEVSKLISDVSSKRFSNLEVLRLREIIDIQNQISHLLQS